MRAAVVLVRSGSVALIERDRAGLRYYLFPGGAVEDGETAAEAARREAHEELGLLVRVGELLHEEVFGGNVQRYYRAVVAGGRFGTGRGEEMSSLATSSLGSYRPVWIPLVSLDALDVRPRAVAAIAERLC
jgi:8-oxo-dGTP pyrophosphatase MutT (NUDIX family)